MRRPAGDVANMGRMVLYKASGTRAASSSTTKAGAEKPRTVASLPGRDSTREPVAAKVQEAALSSASAGAGSSRPRSSANLRNSSPAWRSDGATSSTSEPGRWSAVWSASTAAVVLLPAWREHSTSVHRALDRSSPRCHSSASNPKRSRAKTTGSSAWRRARATSRMAGDVLRHRRLERRDHRPLGVRVLVEHAQQHRLQGPQLGRRGHGRAHIDLLAEHAEVLPEQPQRAQLVDGLD